MEVPEQKQNRTIILESRNGVRYTVPVVIRPERMPEEMTVRFRVGLFIKTVISAAILMKNVFFTKNGQFWHRGDGTD